jgi:hypothetical protein
MENASGTAVDGIQDFQDVVIGQIADHIAQLENALASGEIADQATEFSAWQKADSEVRAFARARGAHLTLSDRRGWSIEKPRALAGGKYVWKAHVNDSGRVIFSGKLRK